MNRREHIYTLHLTLQSNACNIFSRNVSAKVSVEHLAMFRRTLPPTFLFLLYKIVKEPAMENHRPNCIRQNRTRQSHRPPQKPKTKSPKTFSHQAKPSGQPEREPFACALIILSQEPIDQPESKANQQPNHRAHSATASGAPPSLCRYIDPTPQNCQHTISQKPELFRKS